MRGAPTLVARACPVCGETERARVFAEETVDASLWTDAAFSSRKLPEYMHFRVLRCEVCQLLYSSPAPDLATLATLYRDASFEASEESRWAARTYARQVTALGISPTTGERKTRVLDIGAGDGAFLEALIRTGFEDVLGLELSSAPIAAAEPRVRGLLRQAAFRAADFEPRSFDLVTCFQTIEHVMAPLELARDVHEVLRPGGRFVVVCHDSRALSARLLGTRSPIFDIEHLQIFAEPSLRSLFGRAGYGPVSVRTLYNTYPLQYWSKLAPLPSALKAVVLGALRATRVGRVPIPLPAGNLVACAGRDASPSSR